MKLLPDLSPEALLIIATAFGAIVHATSKWQKARNKSETYNAVDFLINFIIATLSGAVFGIGARIFFPESIDVIILFAAMGAFLGLAGLNSVGIIILDVVGAKLKAKN